MAILLAIPPAPAGAVGFQYEWHDDSGQWFRSHCNENWEFTPEGLMSHR
jgi:nuclear transport factor 2 (NTF2) superfamily protein